MAEAISSIMGSYSRLVDDVVEIFVLLLTTFFSVVGCWLRQIARVFMVPTVKGGGGGGGAMGIFL